MIAALMILVVLAGVPPLTADQQEQLRRDDPAGQFEGPALRPLLENVLGWEPDELDSTGVVEPDYDALSTEPVASRGELCLIEGRFAGRARRFSLSQTGRWGGALTEWVLVVRDKPEQVAVIYFVDPENKLTAPHAGASVRVPARFYKVWTDTDQHGQPTDYLTFIARSPLHAASGKAPTRLGSALPLLLGVLVLALIYVFVLRLSRATSRRCRSAPNTAKSAGDAMLSDLPDTPLPDDPAEALERLATRQRDL